MSTITITKEQLKFISGGYGSQSVLDGLVEFLPQYLPGYKIDTHYRLAAFLANACHETDHFNTLHEYASGAEYEGRKDLGNTQPGDGVRYKGRGIFMITGRYNYRKYGSLINEPLEEHPETASDPEISVNLACEFWDDHNLSELADAQNFKEIVHRINGGYNGYNDRLAYYKKALTIVDKMIQGE